MFLLQLGSLEYLLWPAVPQPRDWAAPFCPCWPGPPGLVGLYTGEVGEYAGDAGEYEGDVGLYTGEVGE